MNIEENTVCSGCKKNQEENISITSCLVCNYPLELRAKEVIEAVEEAVGAASIVYENKKH